MSGAIFMVTIWAAICLYEGTLSRVGVMPVMYTGLAAFVKCKNDVAALRPYAERRGFEAPGNLAVHWPDACITVEVSHGG